MISNKIAEWKEHLLSTGKIETLIKAVASAIPVYAMASFRLSKSFCSEVNSMM